MWIWEAPDVTPEINALNERLTLLGSVVDDQAELIKQLRAELDTKFKEQMTRYHVLNEELSALESRIVIRIEELENPTKLVNDNSTYYKEGEQVSSNGIPRWSQRKKEAELRDRKDEVWLKPRIIKETEPTKE